MVRLVSVFGKTFCEVDLTEIFRKGECVGVDGRGKGEAELSDHIPAETSII